MNKSKKIFVITITILMLVGLTTITATDTNTTDTTTITDTSQSNSTDASTATEITQSSTIKGDTIISTSVASTSQTDNMQETTNSEETINNKPGTKTQNLKADTTVTVTNFTQLNNNLTSDAYDIVTINIGDNIQLAGYITVSSAIKNLTINGNAKIINGNNQYQFLYMNHPINVTINNLSITQCNSTGFGGAIMGLSINMTIINSIFTNNNANGSGGAIHVHGSDLTVTNSTFINNTAKSNPYGGSGGAIDSSYGNLTIINSYLTNNNAIWGGAVANNGNITVINSTLNNNNASMGGAIYNQVGNLTITQSTLNNNYAPSGGAISGGDIITITNSTLYNNSVGAISAYNVNLYDCNITYNNGGPGTIFISGNITVTNTNFTNNNGFWAGAISSYGDIITVTNSTFTHNIATEEGNGGGAIFGYGNITVTNSTFTNNTAEFGGAICGHLNNPIIVENSNFTHNNATHAGGAIWGYAGNVTVQNSNLVHNNAIGSGGAIGGHGNITVINNNFLSNNAGNGAIFGYGNIIVINNNFSYNNASTGGAIHGHLNSSITVENSNFTHNNVHWFGGAIYGDMNSTITITNSTLTHNIANNSGGAIYNEGNITIKNSTLTNNTANNEGGAISNSNGTITITNTNFTNNIAGNGGAISNMPGILNMTNSTLNNNKAEFYGGAIANLGVYTIEGIQYGTVSLHNIILNSNIANNGGALFTGGNMSIHNITANNNIVNSSGGAIHNVGNLTIINTTLYNNNAAFWGGAIYNEGNLSITNNNIRHNKGNSQGGAIFTQNGIITIAGSNLTYNQGGYGGAIYGAGNLTLKNSNITDNYVTSKYGYVIDLSHKDSIIITNNTFINNTDNTRDMLFSDASTSANVDIHGNTYIDNFLEDTIIQPNVTVVTDNEARLYDYYVDVNLREIYNDAVRNGTLNVYVNGVLTNTTEVLNGISRIFLENSDLTKRENNITLEYISQSKHYQNTTTSFIIYKEAFYSVVTVNHVEGTVLDNITFIANIRDYKDKAVNGGYVIFKVSNKTLAYENGTQIRTPVENGVAKLSYTAESGWIVDTHPNLSVQAVFSGTSLVSANRSDISKVTIYKRNATVEVSAPDDYVNGTLHIDAVVKDQNGSLIKDGVLVFKLNGLSLKDENNKGIIAQVSNGRVHLDVKLPFAYSAKKYNLTAVYSNKIYNKATGLNTTALKAIPTYVNATVTIKDQFSKPVVTGQIYNGFNDAILQGTAVINIKFDGISYAKKVKVNNGTFSETLEGIPIYKPGTHKVEVVAGANSHYEAVRKTYTTKATPKYNVTTVFTNITRNKTTTRVQARIVDDINKNVQRNLTVTIKLNGKSFLINRTVTNGNVDVVFDTSSLKNRTYSLELVSGANTYYNAGKSTTELPKY